MGFDVSSLTNYTQKATQLLREGVLFSDSMANYSIQTGIKYIEPLNILDTDVYFQAGACSLGNSGDTKISEKNITVASYAVKKSFCVQDLQKKNLPLVPGSGLESLAPELEAVLTDDIIAKTKAMIEADLWLGKSGLIDGWFKNLSGCTGAISITQYSGVTITQSNVDDVFAEFVSKITDAMWSRGVLTIHCSVPIYNMYKRNRLEANYYHDNNANQLGAMETWYFGYEGQIKVKAEPGLAGSNFVMLTWDKNLFIGVDEINEESYAKWVYDEVTDLLWYKSYFKLGTQIAFCNEVIHNMY